MQTRQSFFKPYNVPAAVTDFLLHCCAILFATTIYSSSPQILNGLLILPCVATYLQSPSHGDKQAKPPRKAEVNGKLEETDDEAAESDLDALPTKPFITTYRGAMMVITCTSILAVDFPAVFPRRFAKTESFGTSLMDVGVGSFVFAAGIMAARQQLKEEESSQTPSFVGRLYTATRHSLPLFVLGFLRLWSIKGLDYAEHVSEYGVHWNFFFTLALLAPATALLHPVLRLTPSYGLLAFFLALGQELILFLPDNMKVYIILSDRKEGDWLSQNREGVFSFLGYLSIFIAGMGIGHGILTRDPDWRAKPTGPLIPEKDPLDEDAEWLASVLGQPAAPGEDATPAEQDNTAVQVSPELPFKPPALPKTAFFHLAKWTVYWFLFTVWAMWHYGPRLHVSRRMANLAYIVWVCAFNTFQLFLFCSVETLIFPDLYKAKDRLTESLKVKEATSRVMHAFNRNGLAIFLLANLLTGSVNLGLETLGMGEVQAMVVLVGYIGVLCGTAMLLDHWDISIKL